MTSWSGRSSRKAFTLVEVLAVVGIIVILVGFLFPAVARLMRQSEVARAQTEVNRIATAIRNYYHETGENPYRGGTGGWAWSIGRNLSPGPKAELAAMYARLTDPNSNSVHRVFLDLPLDDDGLLRDPWGNSYVFIFADPDRASTISADGRSISGYGGHIGIQGGMMVVVRSLGPDGVMTDFTASGSDDILSYK